MGHRTLFKIKPNVQDSCVSANGPIPHPKKKTKKKRIETEAENKWLFGGR
jgi:hypothetical protein